MSTKILVTGGTGFIGSNLCEHLLENGYAVRCLDNFATGKWQNIIPLINRVPDTFEMFVGDSHNHRDLQLYLIVLGRL